MSSSPANAAPPSGLSERIRLYLEDAPSSGGHSDAAGANCWELLQEAMEELRIRAQQTTDPVAWLDIRTADLGWQNRIIATNPQYVENNGPENFVALYASSFTPPERGD